MIKEDELNGYEEELNEAEEKDLVSEPVQLPEPVKFDETLEKEVVDFVRGKSENSADITKITKKAAERLNLGLLFENIRVILELQRQREKVIILEKQIYSEDGVNADKNLVALYNSERTFYMGQLEYVRKYVLNNKSAMDDLNREPNEILEMLTQLSGEKLTKLKEFLGELASENSVNDDDLLEEQ